jgi:allantoin racemase
LRIKFIIPFPLGPDGVARRTEQIPFTALRPETSVDCVPVRDSFISEAPRSAGTYYELALMEMYVIDTGLRSQDEGYDALVIDTVSDSGIHVLRSRLSIPVIGPGLVSYCLAIALGKRFSIVTYGEEHKFMFEKSLNAYGLQSNCASVRAANAAADVDRLLTDDLEEKSRNLTEAARRAVDEDGADVIVLGSTTMHQAGAYMAAHLSVPVINPGPVAIKFAEALVELGLSHSKIAYPSPSVNQDEKWHSLAGVQL